MARPADQGNRLLPPGVLDGLVARGQEWRAVAVELLALALPAPVLLFPQRFAPPLLALAVVVLLAPRVAAAIRARRLLPATTLGSLSLTLGLFALVAAWAAPEWRFSLPKVLGVTFGLAVLLAVRQVMAALKSRAPAAAVAALAVQGAAIAAIGLLASRWNVGKLPWLAAVYDRLHYSLPQVQTSTRVVSGLEPNEVAGALLLVFPPVAVWAITGRQRPAARVAHGAAAGLMGVVLLLTLSRSAYMGLAAGALTLLALRWPRLTAAAAGALAVAAGALLWTRGLRGALAVAMGSSPVGNQVAAGAGSQGRFQLWDRGLQILRDFPLSGAGLNGFPSVADALYPPFLHGAEPRVAHAHNFALQSALDLGVPGFAAFLALVGVVAGCWWLGWRRPVDTIGAPDGVSGRRVLLAGALAGLLAYGAYGLTDAVTLGAKPGYLLWLLLGIVAGLGAQAVPFARRWPGLAALGAPVVLAAILLWGASWPGLTPWRLIAAGTLSAASPGGPISILAGTGSPGFAGDGGPGALAALAAPESVALAADGSLYLADSNNHRIRQIRPDGTIVTVAGLGCCPMTYAVPRSSSSREAVFSYPLGIAAGADGSVYVADTNNHRIRQIRRDNTVLTVAGGGGSATASVGDVGGFAGDGGPALAALLSFPTGVAVTPDGRLFIADSDNHRVRVVTPDGVIMTIAGSGKRGAGGDGGPARDAQLSFPRGVVVGSDGELYIGDANGHRVRMVDRNGTISTVPGDAWVKAVPGGDRAAGALTPDQWASHLATAAIAPDGVVYLASPAEDRILVVRPGGGR